MKTVRDDDEFALSQELEIPPVSMPWKRKPGRPPQGDRLDLIKERHKNLAGSAAAAQEQDHAQKQTEVTINAGDLVLAVAVHALIQRSGPTLNIQEIGAMARDIRAAVVGKEDRVPAQKRCTGRNGGRHKRDCSCEKCVERRKAKIKAQKR